MLRGWWRSENLVLSTIPTNTKHLYNLCAMLVQQGFHSEWFKIGNSLYRLPSSSVTHSVGTISITFCWWNLVSRILPIFKHEHLRRKGWFQVMLQTSTLIYSGWAISINTAFIVSDTVSYLAQHRSTELAPHSAAGGILDQWSLPSDYLIPSCWESTDRCSANVCVQLGHVGCTSLWLHFTTDACLLFFAEWPHYFRPPGYILQCNGKLDILQWLRANDSDIGPTFSQTFVDCCNISRFISHRRPEIWYCSAFPGSMSYLYKYPHTTV